MSGYRILLLNTLMEAGGAQKAMLQLAQGLRDRGNHVVVVTMYDKGDYVTLFRERYGIPIISLEMKGSGKESVGRKVWRVMRGVRRLWKLMRRERVDVLQTYSHYSNIFGPIIGWAARIPVRVTSQRMSLVNQPKWVLTLDRVVANSWLSHQMVSVSEHTRRFSIDHERIRGDKVLTIPNGIDPAGLTAVSSSEAIDFREELDLTPDRLLVTVVARLHPQKGHRYLLDAIPGVLAREPRATFVFVGDGELLDEIRDAVRRARLDDSVILLGSRPDVPRILKASDLFVLPSLWEGMPNAVLEAMAAGLPVVATAVDGTPEVVLHEETGLLVPPKDPNALELAIVSLLLDEAKRKAYGGAGQRRVIADFSLAAYVDRHIALYGDHLEEERVS